MSIKWLSLFLILNAFLLSSVPTNIVYQGYLTQSGNPANGERNFIFTLNPGNLIFPFDNVVIKNGAYTVNIPIPIDALNPSNSYTLEVKVEGILLNPSVPLKAVPYSYYASSLDGIVNVSSNGNVGIGKSDPQAKLDVAGGIKSTMWKTTQLFNSEPGPLPLSANFTSGGGTILIIASGSGWKTSVGLMGMSIAVDSSIKGYCKKYANALNTHGVFTMNSLVVTNIGAGVHTLELANWSDTTTDPGDFFSVTIIEFPF